MTGPYLSVRDYFPIEVSGCCLRVAFSGVRLLSESTAGVKKILHRHGEGYVASVIFICRNYPLELAPFTDVWLP